MSHKDGKVKKFIMMTMQKENVLESIRIQKNPTEIILCF